MIRHFFLDKTNSIFKGTRINTGYNPILKLNYGKNVSRGLLHFDESEIRQLIEDRTFADTSKLTFKLKMTNCMSVDGMPFQKELFENCAYRTMRASSFDLVLYELPQYFDAGNGYAFDNDFWIEKGRSEVFAESNWYFPIKHNVWICDKDKLVPDNLVVTDWENYCMMIDWDTAIYTYGLEGGIYSTDFIQSAITDYQSGVPSVVVSMQHFDHGFENLEMDITDYVFGILYGEKENFGLCLSFTPDFEAQKTKEQQHVAFFTDHTNTFFHPYVEAIYDEYIQDDRQSAYKGKENRLYFYSYVGGQPTNLDGIPRCEIDGEETEVIQQTKGVYYTKTKISEVADNTILNDVWSDIIINGEDMGEVENEFVALPKSGYFRLGQNTEVQDTVVPVIAGVNDAERLRRGEIRTVIVDFRKKFSTDKKVLVDNAEYRVYVMDGTRELDVLSYQKVEKSFLNNFFTIYTKDLIPGGYHVDIKYNDGHNERLSKDILYFTVVDNVTNREM